jgi:hypothetical protein
MESRKQFDREMARGATGPSGESLGPEVTPDSSLSKPTGSRLSLQRCRAMLDPACELTDSQVFKLRDALYDLANVALVSSRNRIGSR